MEQYLGSSSENVLAMPIRGGRSLTTAERRDLDLSSSIKGWASDLDPANRPGVPMDKAPEIGIEYLYIDVEQQVPKFKIHKSTEHARMTPVFGTSCPPSGLSGRIRDLAYTRSEGRLSHWMLLMFADRVNVVEDILSELARFHIPNIPKEMGFAAELKYNRKGVLKGAALIGLGVLGLVALSTMRKKSRLSFLG